MRAIRTSLVVLTALAALAGTSEARTRPPHLSWIKCTSACTDARTVAPGGKVKLAGSRFPKGARVIFPVKRNDGNLATRSVKPLTSSATRLVAKVPANARNGRLYVHGSTGPRSN